MISPQLLRIPLFCDAMFVDKEIAHFASQSELRRELNGKARLFSLRKDDKGAFLAYLTDIESSASANHLKLVSEVYGLDWPTPYADILAPRHH